MGSASMGVRWNTVTWAATLAASWITCTPLAPVPITPTRRPASGTPCCGQCAVWWHLPANDSRPGKSGTEALAAKPVHGIRKRARSRPPPSVSTSQWSLAVSKRAAVTRVFRRTSRDRSSFASTWWK
jgi:hypothetical protein